MDNRKVGEMVHDVVARIVLYGADSRPWTTHCAGRGAVVWKGAQEVWDREVPFSYRGFPVTAGK